MIACSEMHLTLSAPPVDTVFTSKCHSFIRQTHSHHTFVMLSFPTARHLADVGHDICTICTMRQSSKRTTTASFSSTLWADCLKQFILDEVYGLTNNLIDCGQPRIKSRLRKAKPNHALKTVYGPRLATFYPVVCYLRSIR